MSRASQLTLAGTSLFAVGTILLVHFQQKFEKQAMHQGVVRDMEQQRIKKERQLDFDMQKALEEEYKKGQTVREMEADIPPATNTPPPAASPPTETSIPDR